MFKNHILKSFTVLELTITVFILALTTAFAVNVVFKVEKTPKKIMIDRIVNLVCFEGSKFSAEHPEQMTYTTDETFGDGCDFEFSAEIISKEFLEIRLIGAGASKGYKSSSGEEKTVIYPSLLMPYARTNDRACDSPFCESCPEKGNICTKCAKGYIVDNDTCKANFTYRAVIGKTPAEGEVGNGGRTYFTVIDNSTNEITILESAAGGTVSSETCPDESCETTQESSSNYGNGSTGKSGEVRISW